MVRVQSKYVCQQCGYETSGWLGKCPNCDSWGSLVEQLIEKKTGGFKRLSKTTSKPLYLSKINSVNYQRRTTGSYEFDRVLGGGIVPGSVILLSGEPGIGKSTILLRLCEELSKDAKVLYISGEESPQQIKMRSDRLSITSEQIMISSQTDVDLILSEIEENSPGLVIVDSIQTITTSDLTGIAGAVGQVRETAARLHRTAKRLHIPLFIIGHVTKEGTIAGPRVLEHLVDVVLYLEGERYHELRILRGVKNRFGPTDEVGIFSMEERGLSDVTDPQKIFLSEAQAQVPGSVVVVASEGTRPILVEVQALVVPTKLFTPRRVANGIDFNRLQMLTAIIQKHLRLPLSDFDVYVNVASGFKISETAADLGICLAIISSFKNKALKRRTAVIGEVGLLGEIRHVPQQEKRIKEARKLGFKNILDSGYKYLINTVKEIF